MHGLWALTLRSLRSDSRLLRFDLLRLAVVAFVLVLLISTFDDSLSGTAPGRTLLLAMLGMNLAFATWGGVLLFAPIIAEEKEAGTLGLLRLTGMGPASLILGSCIPKLTQMGLILLVQFPMLCLCVTLGGVDWTHVWTAFLLVGTQSIFVASGSLLASVVARTSGRAIAVALIANMLWSELVRIGLRTLGIPWTTLSISNHVQQMQMSGASSQGVEFAVLFHLCLSAIGILFAVGLFDRFNRHEISGEPVLSLWQRCLAYYRNRAYQRSKGKTDSAGLPLAADGASDAHRSQRPTFAVWQNSLAWKDFFLLGGGRTGFLTRSAFAFVGTLGICLFTDAVPTWIGESILNASLWVLAVDTIYLTVNLFGSEIRGQTWESLQTLPLPLGVICRQKILGAALHLIPWVAAAAIGAWLAELPAEGWDELVQSPLTFVVISIHVIIQIVTCVLTLTLLSLRLNPWTATLVTGVIHGAIIAGIVISALMTFGIFGPLAPPWKIALFNLLWTGGVALYGAWGKIAICRRLDPGATEW